MTMDRTIWDLCQETFGQIPARWRAKIEALAIAYTPAQLEEAFAIAKHHNAKSIEYVIEVAGRLREAALAGRDKAEATGNRRLLCDNCRLPEWIDNMVVRTHQGICRTCADVEPGRAVDLNLTDTIQMRCSPQKVEKARADSRYVHDGRLPPAGEEAAWERTVRCAVRDNAHAGKRAVELAVNKLGPRPVPESDDRLVWLKTEEAMKEKAPKRTATAELVAGHWAGLAS